MIGPLVDIGPSALVALTVLLVLFGKLVPVSRYKELLKDKEYWRDAYKESEKQRDELLEVANTVKHVMESLQREKDNV